MKGSLTSTRTTTKCRTYENTNKYLIEICEVNIWANLSYRNLNNSAFTKLASRALEHTICLGCFWKRKLWDENLLVSDSETIFSKLKGPSTTPREVVNSCSDSAAFHVNLDNRLVSYFTEEERGLFLIVFWDITKTQTR